MAELDWDPNVRELGTTWHLTIPHKVVHLESVNGTSYGMTQAKPDHHSWTFMSQRHTVGRTRPAMSRLGTYLLFAVCRIKEIMLSFVPFSDELRYSTEWKVNTGNIQQMIKLMVNIGIYSHCTDGICCGGSLGEVRLLRATIFDKQRIDPYQQNLSKNKLRNENEVDRSMIATIRFMSPAPIEGDYIYNAILSLCWYSTPSSRCNRSACEVRCSMSLEVQFFLSSRPTH